MAKDSRKLREQAQKLLDEAERIEQAKVIKIGKLVMKYKEAGFKNFDVEAFKKEITNI